MKTWISRLLFIPLFLFTCSLSAAEGQELIVHNRILATVNGKAVSVMDVMKKMDVFLSRNYPEHSKSDTSRYQFFIQNWRDTLNQIIDNELILADAEKLEIKIADAEVREKIHERFGPNVMASLDELGLTLDEAWHMIYAEMAVQRMSWYRVHSKAMHRIGPQDIKVGYEAYLAQNPPQEEWKYQVLSIRAATDSLGKVFAQKAQALLQGEPLPFEALASKLKEGMKDDSNVTITVSDELDVAGSKLSEAHKTVLCTLKPGSYSEPVSQVSRRDQSVVHRIFYLKEHKVIPPKSFDAMVDALHDQLVMKEVNKEFPLYLKKLRKQFNYEGKELSSLPNDFVPFELK